MRHLRDLYLPRHAGSGGAYMRVRVFRARPWTRSAALRMGARRRPPHQIAQALGLERHVVNRILRREVWRG